MAEAVARRGPDGVARAALLGVAGGARASLAPAVLAARGRLHGPARFAALAALAGELAYDKVPVIPDRTDPPGVVTRMLASGAAGSALGGLPGVVAGAAGALVGSYATAKARADLTDALALPAPVVAALEDAAALGVGAVATAGLDADDEPLPQAFDPADPAREATPEPPSAVGGIARGVAAGLVGTAVMTAAQLAYYRVSGDAQSVAPANVGQKVLGLAGVRVKRRQKPVLNQVMHVLYGTSWGVAYGVAAAGASTARPALVSSGLAFGAGVWGSSLVELPALDQAPPFWRMPPAHLALDAGFHLVYGLSTAAAFRALSR